MMLIFVGIALACGSYMAVTTWLGQRRQQKCYEHWKSQQVVAECRTCGMKFVGSAPDKCVECGADYVKDPRLRINLVVYGPGRRECDYVLNWAGALATIDKFRDKLEAGYNLSQDEWACLIEALRYRVQRGRDIPVKIPFYTRWSWSIRRYFFRQLVESLKVEDVEWVVNDGAELGVKIGHRLFWLYKGRSLEYSDELGEISQYRAVEKREFGEICRPTNVNSMQRYTKGEGWAPLPFRQEKDDCE